MGAYKQKMLEEMEDFHLIQQSIEDDEIKTGENQ